MLAIVRLSIRFFGHLTCCENIVCRILAAPVVLETNFCNRFVATIFPQTRVIKLEDETNIPTIRRPLKFLNQSLKAPFLASLKDAASSSRPTPAIRFAEALNVPSRPQCSVNVATRIHGLIVLQSRPRKYLVL